MLLAFIIIAINAASIVRAAEESSSPVKAGIIGLDTSHVTAFSGILNNPNAKGPLAYVQVVAAFPAGSPDLEVSAGRLEKFTNTVREKHGSTLR